ncbi:MAG: CbtA family protein [Methylococcales bacterium]|nr:CbtA family protein [Methylococcales bacterium]
MFNRIVLSALLAGTVAAILLSIIQVFWVTPMILEAETYEISVPSSINHGEVVDEAWEPEDGWERTLSTAGSNIVIAFGFSLVLTGFYSLFKTSKLYQGLGWGAAGYVAFFAAPALGLSPELPGTVAANLVDRQYWFLGTVFSTALGLALIFLPHQWFWRLLGILLVLTPHLIGAPQPEVHETLAPHALVVDFIRAAWISNAFFWLVLGTLSLILFRFFSPTKEVA